MGCNWRYFCKVAEEDCIACLTVEAKRSASNMVLWCYTKPQSWKIYYFVEQRIPLEIKHMERGICHLHVRSSRRHRPRNGGWRSHEEIDSRLALDGALVSRLDGGTASEVVSLLIYELKSG